MFGLMKRAPRLPYCGTCKTMGAIYGQGTRFLLNHDTVFLAELLMEHSGQPEWSAAYRTRNCMAVPQGELPLALQFAAAATVALAHFRIADHCVDSKSRMWRIAERLSLPSFRRASAQWSDGTSRQRSWRRFSRAKVCGRPRRNRWRM